MTIGSDRVGFGKIQNQSDFIYRIRTRPEHENIRQLKSKPDPMDFESGLKIPETQIFFGLDLDNTRNPKF